MDFFKVLLERSEDHHVAQPATSAGAQGAQKDRYDITMADCDETSKATGGKVPGDGTVATC